MKRIMMLSAAALVSLSALTVRAELNNADFEQVDAKGKCVGWYLANGFVREKGAGSNGSAGLSYFTDSDAANGCAMQGVTIEPGATYSFGAWVKADDVTGKGPCFICLSFRDKNNKWIAESRSDAVRRSTNGEWVKLEGISKPAPAGAVKGAVSMCVQNTLHGHFFFDKVYFEKFVREPVVGLYTSAYCNEAYEGDVDFAAALTPAAFGCAAKQVKAVFSVRGPSGRSFSVDGRMPLSDEARVTIPVARFEVGTNTVACTLKQEDRTIGKAQLTFERLAAPPTRRVTIDRNGRTIVNGKPMFVYGMYTGGEFFKGSNFTRYCEAPFNCFMEYGPVTHADLDRCAKAGVYSIQGISAWYTQPDKGSNSVLRAVRDVKDHPGILAWYMFDELPVSLAPVLTDRYNYVHALDPNHPIWCAQDIWGEARHFIPACDAFGADPYPVSRQPVSVVTDAMRGETRGLMGMRPIWQVVQYFGWNWHDPKQAHQRRPSEREFRNMTWQAIAGGARGIIYYAYGYLCRKPELAGEKVEDLWAEMKRVSGEVMKHERVLLFADTKAIPAANLQPGVIGRTFRSPDETWTLLVNTTTNAAPAFGLEPLGVSMKPGTILSGLDEADLVGKTDKRAIDYKVGEPIKLTISLRGAKDYEKGKWFFCWDRMGDDGKTERGKVPLEKMPFTYETTLGKPGFFRVIGYVKDAKGNIYHKKFQGDATTPEGRQAMNEFERGSDRIFFDGGACAGADQIVSVPEPQDFDAFWARRKARLARVPMVATCTLAAKQRRDDETSYAVSVTCAGPRPTTGYLTVPKKPGKYPIYVLVHGYGHTYPNKGHVVHPISCGGNTLAFYCSPHGYELEREPEYYDEFFRSICSGGKTFCFDEKQNADPETSYFSGYTYRLMRALEYLKTRPEWDGRNIVVEGGSMGGMQSIWLAALDSAVTLVRPVVPWNCDMGGRDTLKRIVDSWYIHETPALRYYDPVNLAKRIPKTCTVDIKRAGLGDYCCPPSGVMALWNALSCPKRIRWVQGSTHGHVPALPNDEFIDHGNMPTLFFAGDSTLDDSGASRGSSGHPPYASWGTALRPHLKPNAQIWNFAMGGFSTKMFIERGWWDRLIREVHTGDFVVIQFGHNDQKHATEEQRKTLFAPPQTDYKANLRRFAAEVRAKGATPVFCTSIVRGTFDKEGRKLVDTTWAGDGIDLGSYVKAVHEVGKELGVDVVDMNKLTGDLCERIGRDEAYKFFVISTGLEYSKDGEPSRDTTHPVKAGAEAFARLFLNDVRTRGLKISELFNPTK